MAADGGRRAALRRSVNCLLRRGAPVRVEAVSRDTYVSTVIWFRGAFASAHETSLQRSSTHGRWALASDLVRA